MELRRLRHAVTLARMLNFTKAAESLNLTQSALSRSIQALEAECQLRLFDRDRSMVEVTRVGRGFIRRAEALLRDEADLRAMVSEAARGEGGEIAIGLPPLASKTLLSPLLLGMMAENRDFHARVVIAGPDRLLRLLVDEDIELCICPAHQMPARAQVTGVPIGRFPISLVVRPGHPLTTLVRIGAADVARYPAVAARQLSGEPDEPNLVASFGQQRPIVSVEDYHVLMEIVMATDAVWITSAFAASERIRDGTLVDLPLAWLPSPPCVDIAAYHRQRRSPSPLIGYVIERLCHLAGEMIAAGTVPRG